MKQNLSNENTDRPREQVLALAAAILTVLLGIITCCFLFAAQGTDETQPTMEFGQSSGAMTFLTLLLLERSRCVYHSRTEEELPGCTCKRVQGCNRKHKISLVAYVCGVLFGVSASVLGVMRNIWEAEFKISEKGSQERKTLPWYLSHELNFAIISLSLFVAFPCFFYLQWYDLENLRRTILLKPGGSRMGPQVEVGAT